MSNGHIELDFDALAEEVLTDIGKLLVKDGKKNMAKTSYGHFEYSYKIRRHRWVSRRGDPPNNETGALSRTIRYKVNGRTMDYGAGNATVNYAKYLENQSQLNRPNITKSVEKGKRQIEDSLQRNFMKHIRWNG